MIEFNELLLAVRELAAQYPDRQTEPYYWDWTLDRPGCLVGTALYQLDVGVPLHRNTVSVTALPWVEMGFREPLGPQLKWLSLVQANTDAGVYWGLAVASADSEFPFSPKAA